MHVGVSQKVAILNKEGTILVIRRTSSAPFGPDTWDLPGGELNFGEEAISGIIRETKEETGLAIKNIRPYDVESHVDERGDFWVTIAYRAKSISEKVALSYEHDRFKWVTKEGFLKLESAKKLKRFIKNLR